MSLDSSSPSCFHAENVGNDGSSYGQDVFVRTAGSDE